MARLVLVALIGLIAQLVDGSMGMAYGITSSTLLLLTGFSPAAASASLHLAEVATTLASGTAHMRMGNVDRRIVLALALPGALGAATGAFLLGRVPGEAVRPVVAAILLVVGLTVLCRFARHRPAVRLLPFTPRWLTPLGLVGGLLDAIGGGGWGPVVTTTLLARAAAAPRTIIGSVSMSETAVAAAASVGFLLSMGWQAFAVPWVLALMAGGVVGAPLAAWIVCKVPRHLLGLLVGGLVVLTNARTLLLWFGAGTAVMAAVYTAVPLLILSAWLWRSLRHRTPAPWLPHPMLLRTGPRPDGRLGRYVGNLDG